MHYNRDISWLGFNFRVLHEAASPDVPLMERFKFLSIFSSNLDEFFRVRYPSILALSKLSPKKKKEVHVADTLAETIQAEIERQLQEYGAILTQQLIPELERTNTILYYNRRIEKEHLKEIKELFLSKVLAFIQPLFFESTPSERFFPENNELYFFVVLKKEAQPELMHSIINIPADKLPRFFELSDIGDRKYIIFIDDIIRENINCIFPGFIVQGVYSIKFNRDAELNLEEDVEEDMLKKIEKQLKKRAIGAPSRFLYEPDMPKNIQLFIANSFGISYEEMFAGGRYHNLKDLAKLPVKDKDLYYSIRKPMSSAVLEDCGNIFNEMEQRDILLHLPYDSYNPILSFFNQAAIDPGVREIYITIYRVAADSHIVNALIGAAKNGKKVTAFVELKARFDEENNIRWSKKMKEAGVRIIYSLPSIKVHSKTAVVVKEREEGETIAYGLLSTGNFNEMTAQFYTDHALFTTDTSVTSELLSLFHFLQEAKTQVVPSDIIRFSTLCVSRFNMIDCFEELINHEIDKASKGEQGLIRIKLNNLEEPYMIDLLYKASQAGVKIELIVRSICCLIPGMAGMSENITIRRIVDKYLEHTRLFIFGQGNDATVMMGSADWMTRNLRRRIEVILPIKDKHCRKELIDYFELQWQDNHKAVTLSSGMEQIRMNEADNSPLHNAQEAIYNYLQNRG
jgi:polyphosphate kinase